MTYTFTKNQLNQCFENIIDLYQEYKTKYNYNNKTAKIMAISEFWESIELSTQIDDSFLKANPHLKPLCIISED